MLTDIFSSFDPATSSLFNSLPSPLFWKTNMIIIMIISSSFWIAPSSLSQILSFPKDTMHSQVSRTFGSHLKGFSPLTTSIFLLLLLINLSGLFPYCFSTSSHLFLTLTLALPLYYHSLYSSFINSPSSFAAGILPSGAPDWLNPFLILAESLSILVRPITLSFRLAANMSAGHVVLSLMGIYAASALLYSSFNFIILIAIQAFYMLFEFGICLIQAYIFCLLLSLYADDHTQ
uniref:ATP synthase subunit a n=1 Tax=Pista cristata TaxID=279652 RepID=B3TJZ9_9ANNE|nr:ATP synthase F0 subunit 6 [Pista cristata]